MVGLCSDKLLRYLFLNIRADRLSRWHVNYKQLTQTEEVLKSRVNLHKKYARKVILFSRSSSRSFDGLLKITCSLVNSLYKTGETAINSCDFIDISWMKWLSFPDMRAKTNFHYFNDFAGCYLRWFYWLRL